MESIFNAPLFLDQLDGYVRSNSINKKWGNSRVQNNINCFPLAELVEQTKVTLESSHLTRGNVVNPHWSSLTERTLRGNECFDASFGLTPLSTEVDFLKQNRERLEAIEKVFDINDSTEFHTLNNFKYDDSVSSYDKIDYDRLFKYFFNDLRRPVGYRGNSASTSHLDLLASFGALGMRSRDNWANASLLALVVVKNEWLYDTVYRLVHNIPINNEALGLLVKDGFNSSSFIYRGFRMAFNKRVVNKMTDAGIGVAYVENIESLLAFELGIPNFLTIEQKQEWTDQVCSEWIEGLKAKDIPTKDDSKEIVTGEGLMSQIENSNTQPYLTLNPDDVRNRLYDLSSQDVQGTIDSDAVNTGGEMSSFEMFDHFDSAGIILTNSEGPNAIVTGAMNATGTIRLETAEEEPNFEQMNAEARERGDSSDIDMGLDQEMNSSISAQENSEPESQD